VDETQRYLLNLTSMTKLQDVWDAHVERMRRYGFDHMLYAATRFRTDNGLGDLRDALILTNYPREFTQIYIDQELFRDAPMVRWAMTNTGARSFADFWKEADQGKLTQAERRVMKFNIRHGIKAGYGISFPRVSARAGYGIGLASTTMSQTEIDAQWARIGDEIMLANQVAHLTILALPHQDLGPGLTDRQREGLELVADGKTVQEVAIILDRKPATVEKHMRLARESLNVETTAQAVLKAGLQTRIFRITG
jgi:LuxR family transcriptional regulator